MNREVLCLRSAGLGGGGSDEGVRVPFLLRLLTDNGVSGGAGEGDCLEWPVIFRANFLKGEMDLDKVLAELGAREEREPLGGVAR